jgi:hypothetical protein
MTDEPKARPTAHEPVPPTGAHTPALDADTHDGLAQDPKSEDAKLDIGVDETFPASDPVSQTQPRKGSEPVKSSGYKGD